MPVTELACLRLKNNLPLSHSDKATLSTKPRAGMEAQAKYSNARTSVLSRVENPSYIYILGTWDSAAQHMEEWVPSQQNQEIMAGLGVDRDEQFVLFSGWETVDEHFSFAQSEGLEEFVRIREFMREAEIQLAQWGFCDRTLLLLAASWNVCTDKESFSEIYSSDLGPNQCLRPPHSTMSYCNGKQIIEPEGHWLRFGE
ncbi:hypothetical protein BDV10DRAFT_184016 [Aspergillus recurvatus]